MLPLHLGWWGNQTWNPPQVEPTFPDDIEYLCCKLIGNNADFQCLAAQMRKPLKKIHYSEGLFLLSGNMGSTSQKLFQRFSKALLRQPGREFTLVRDDGDDW
jgi:hypothetical protein